MLWKCPFCGLEFTKTNQAHSCLDKSLADFLDGKTPHSIGLLEQLTAEFGQIGAVTIRPTKSMISFAARKRFAYVIHLGKNFIDVVFPFKQAYTDNLCFNKIKPVPGSDDYNHHLRLYVKEDINDEVRKYMKMAYENGL